MNYKKYLSGVLAAAMVLNTGAVSVLAAGTDTSVQEASQTQTSSTPETVYVNSYDGKERSVSFNDHWRFYLGELNGAEAVSYNDESTNNLSVAQHSAENTDTKIMLTLNAITKGKSSNIPVRLCAWRHRMVPQKFYTG